MTDYENLKKTFDDIGVEYTEQHYTSSYDIEIYYDGYLTIFEFTKEGKFKKDYVTRL